MYLGGSGVDLEWILGGFEVNLDGFCVDAGRCGSLMREVWKSHAGGAEVSCGRCGS